MSLFEKESAVSALEKMLVKERDAILESDFQTLSKLGDKKEALLKRVAVECHEADSLRQLQQKLTANNALLDSAARGIKSAVNYIGDMQASPKPLQTYGPLGERNELGRPALTIERKA
ncbi:hypothetical protein ACP2AV_00245 [Aliiroseovarius sp. PTFE2010]|uniref:hypothetical protein n=1 Tax=Aliiroseovarius sp. PTFE2010 TaxID=3417190 RepID=UPI003CF31659